MKKKIITIVLIVIALLVAFVASIFFLLGSQAKEPVVDFSTDKIPTLYSVVGERNLTGISTKTSTSSGFTRKIFTYKAGAVSMGDLEKYILSLKEKDYIITRSLKDGNGKIFIMCTESNEDGNILSVEIYVDLSGIIITYTKGLGSLNRY